MWPFHRKHVLALPPHIPSTFSEAIRMGSEGTEQAIGTYGGKDRCCTISAAFRGAYGRWCMDKEVPGRDGWTYSRYIQGMLCIKYPILRETIKCPVCKRKGMLVKIVDDHLNDEHFWSRNEIADWVEKLETQIEANKIVAKKWNSNRRSSKNNVVVS